MVNTRFHVELPTSYSTAEALDQINTGAEQRKIRRLRSSPIVRPIAQGQPEPTINCINYGTACAAIPKEPYSLIDLTGHFERYTEKS